MGSFAAFALGRLPDLEMRLAQPDVTRWLAAQEKILVDGETMLLIWGDRMVDEAEAKLGWAREHRLVDARTLATLEAEYRKDWPDPATETIELD